MTFVTYKERVRRLSDRLVDVQRPIRVLDSLKWDPSILQKFKKSKFKEIPDIGPEYFATVDPGFDFEKKREELSELIKDIERELGPSDALGGLLIRNCTQYLDVVEMIRFRGHKKFGEYSKKLYGSTKDAFYTNGPKIAEMGHIMYQILSGLGSAAQGAALGPEYPENLDAKDVVDELNRRFSNYFGENEGVKAKISDGIIADAAAGGDVVKIKEGAFFSKRDVNILEVHEGWVHVGTSINGSNQHVASWLSKGPPQVAATQEGLAVIMEIFTFSSYPKRARIINDRILGIEKAEDGASILDLIEFYQTEGYSEEDCLTCVKRVFRGGNLDGGAPFTKDISYCKGLIENYNFLRVAVRMGKPFLAPFLFVGKIYVDDIPLLYQKHLEGIIDAPKFLPPQFADLNGLVVWMSFSNFFNKLDVATVQQHYASIFKAQM